MACAAAARVGTSSDLSSRSSQGPALSASTVPAPRTRASRGPASRAPAMGSPRSPSKQATRKLRASAGDMDRRAPARALSSRRSMTAGRPIAASAGRSTTASSGVGASETASSAAQTMAMSRGSSSRSSTRSFRASVRTGPAPRATETIARAAAGPSTDSLDFSPFDSLFTFFAAALASIPGAVAEASTQQARAVAATKKVLPEHFFSSAAAAEPSVQPPSNRAAEMRASVKGDSSATSTIPFVIALLTRRPSRPRIAVSTTSRSSSLRAAFTSAASAFGEASPARSRAAPCRSDGSLERMFFRASDCGAVAGAVATCCPPGHSSAGESAACPRTGVRSHAAAQNVANRRTSVRCRCSMAAPPPGRWNHARTERARRRASSARGRLRSNRGDPAGFPGQSFAWRSRIHKVRTRLGTLRLDRLSSPQAPSGRGEEPPSGRSRMR